MLRRDFFRTLSGALAPGFAFAQAGKGRMKVAAVEVWRVEGRREFESGATGQYQVNPLHVYEDHRPRPFRESAPSKSMRPVSAFYLKIKSDAGLEGVYGPVDREAAIVVQQQLRRFVTGKDALAQETLWDLMHRSNRHSRRGHFMMAISAVDNTLWDLRARYFGVPVYRLLGGPSRAAVDAYASCLGFSIEPEPLRRRAVQFKEQGFRFQKWFCAYGPGDGPAGLKKNVEMVRNLREAVGDEVDLMFDAYSGWDLNYALAWAKQVEQYRPRWIEEAFHPEKVQSFATLRRSTSIPVASGEHFYGRWEVHDYLRQGALNVVQADPEWCGGISELVKICTVASLHDAQVIPHGHALHTPLHLAAAQSPMTCPMVEYLINKMVSYHHFEKYPPTLAGGKVALTERPGFGIELDPAKVEKQTLMDWS
jgi:L-rhamnonate dehydratase